MASSLSAYIEAYKTYLERTYDVDAIIAEAHTATAMTTNTFTVTVFVRGRDFQVFIPSVDTVATLEEFELRLLSGVPEFQRPYLGSALQGNYKLRVTSDNVAMICTIRGGGGGGNPGARFRQLLGVMPAGASVMVDFM